MIGREVVSHTPKHLLRPLGDEVLRAENLSSSGKFNNVSFSLRAGEALGFAGLVGAGRSEVVQSIFGLDEAATGKVYVRGNELQLRDVNAVLAAGIGLCPEDCKRLELVLTMNCRENISLAALDRLTRRGFVRRSDE